MKDLNYTLSAIESNAVNASPLPYFREYTLAMSILTPMCVIIIFGVVANVINIVVFLKTGAIDNVTTLLLSLSVSDLVFLSLLAPSMVGIFILNLSSSNQLTFNVNRPFVITYWPAFTAYDISTFISVSLGVMRCACVAMPLKFKFVFTKSRTVKCVLLLVVLAIALRFPVLTVNRLAWRRNPESNTTELYVKQVNRQTMSRFNDIINRGIVIYLNYTTMVACVIILTVKLYQASKIRRACTSSTENSTGKTKDKGLSSKDFQVVKSVILVCTIFILSQFLFIVTSSIRLFDPTFDAGGDFGVFFAIMNQITNTCSYINASVNIFVYFNFNGKYRTTFLSLFCKERKGR